MSASQPAAPSPLEELLAALDVNLTLGSLVIGENTERSLELLETHNALRYA